MKKMMIVVLALLLQPLLSACSAEPGSESWCRDMKGQPKAEWTMQDTKIFTQHCVLGNYKE